MLAILQFDAASTPVVERLVAQGGLPAVAELSRVGRRHRLRAASPCLEGATAPTVHSGRELESHGIYYPFQWSPGDQRVRFRALPAPEPVWQRIGRVGRRSLVVDPYEARPPAAMEGVCLSGWQFTNRVVLRGWSVPGPLRGQLARRLGRPAVADEVYGRPSPAALLRLRSILLDAPRRVAEATAELLAREQFDLAWVNFSATHTGGHQFWDVTRLAGGLDAADRRALETALEDIYRSTDRAIGRVLAALPDGADVILLSTTGMGPDSSRAELLPGMLGAVLAGRASRAAGPGSPLWRVRATVPTRVRAAAARLMPDRAAIELTARLALGRVDWEATRAFALPSDQCGYVRLNVRGRERAGIVDPEHCEALIEEIATGLESFHDSEGAPIVAGVARGGAGDGRGALPDLIVRWSERPPGPGAISPRFGALVRPGQGSGRSGSHTDDAWAIVAPARSRPRDPGRPARLVDVAATACASLGVDRDGLDGEPLLEPAW